MTDYNTLLSQAQSELQALLNKKAVQDSQISELVLSLNLNPSEPLLPQIDSLKESLNKESAELEGKINSILSELDGIVK